MSNNHKSYIAVFGKNEFENLQMIFEGWFKNIEMHIITHGIVSPTINIVKHIPFIRRYVASAKKHNIHIYDYKGLWYELTKKARDLAVIFYDEKLRDNKLIRYYSRLLDTDKFEAYIKKEISYHIFAVLEDLHLIRLSHSNADGILLSKNSINEFIIAYMENRYKIKYCIAWVLPKWKFFALPIYYGWFVMEFIKRGIVFAKKQKNYKISMEAAWGFHQKTLRNDILLDNNKFKLKDILLLRFENINHVQRINAFKEAKKRGFDIACLPELKININNHFKNILFFYALLPAKSFFRLFLNPASYLFYYIILFHKQSFPIEILMNLYRIRCHISMKDWGDAAETIILNKYGAKNIIFHWSDLTFYKAHSHSFTTHNIYFVWGDIHYDYHAKTYFVDKKVNIGCIFKKEIRRGMDNKERILSRIDSLRKENKIVTFFDTSFNKIDARNIRPNAEFSERMFLGYLELIKEFCEKNKNINILVKPKSVEGHETQLSAVNYGLYNKLRSELMTCNNFIYLDPSVWGIEEAIGISDVCVSMGMNTPATIALICGKNALYFDNTGNMYHPFAAKYRNLIVFENRELLYSQINRILEGKFDCKDVITEREIREYDTFSDDNALERLRDNLYELTLPNHY